MAQRQAHPEQAVGGTLDARPWFDGVGEGPVPAAHSRPARADCADAVATVFADYISRRLNCSGLEYVQRPTELSGGWETYTYALQFQRHAALPEPFTRPLILRIYSCRAGL